MIFGVGQQFVGAKVRLAYFFTDTVGTSTADMGTLGLAAGDFGFVETGSSAPTSAGGVWTSVAGGFSKILNAADLAAPLNYGQGGGMGVFGLFFPGTALITLKQTMSSSGGGNPVTSLGYTPSVSNLGTVVVIQSTDPGGPPGPGTLTAPSGFTKLFSMDRASSTTDCWIRLTGPNIPYAGAAFSATVPYPTVVGGKVLELTS